MLIRTANEKRRNSNDCISKTLHVSKTSLYTASQPVTAHRSRSKCSPVSLKATHKARVIYVGQPTYEPYYISTLVRHWP